MSNEPIDYRTSQVELRAESTSPFGELFVVNRTPVIELNSSFGTSNLRDIQTTANSGTIAAASTGEIKLSTSATANGSAILESAERCRYIPGYGAEIGIGVRVPTSPTDNQYLNWGARTPDGNEALYFGMDSTGLYVARKRGGVETKTRQGAWNIDPVNGFGRSGITFDPSGGHIFQIIYSWYGYGQIVWAIIVVINGRQRAFPVHAEKVTGTTSLQSPNLALFQEADNGGDEANIDLYVGGRQYSILGQYIPRTRISGDYRGSVSTSTTAIPTVTFRAKTGFLDRGLRVRGFTITPATADVIVEIRVNGALTSASYATPTNYTASETAVERDISASAITGGEIIYSDFFPAGAANKAQSSGPVFLDLDIPEAQPVSLCVRTVSGTGTATAFLQMTEEW